MLWLLTLLLSQDAPKKEFKVGVVNLRSCFDPARYDRIKERDAELEKLLQDLARSLEEAQTRIERLRLEVSGMKPEMELYWDKIGKLKLAEAELEFKRRHGRQQYVNRSNQLALQVYAEVRRVVTLYAKDRGYDLILRAEEPTLENDETAPSTAAQIQSRIVLYHGDALDITKDVLRILNEEYAKQRAAKKP